MKNTSFLFLTLVVVIGVAGSAMQAQSQTPARPDAYPWPTTPLPNNKPITPIDYPVDPFPRHVGTYPIPRAKGPYQFQPTSGQIKEAKAILKQHGLYSGKQNEKLDKETKTALTAYQRARNIKPTGMLDKSTLAGMGIPLTKEQERREERYTQIRPRGK
jgi:hypothetical protein